MDRGQQFPKGFELPKKFFQNAQGTLGFMTPRQIITTHRSGNLSLATHDVGDTDTWMKHIENNNQLSKSRPTGTNIFLNGTRGGLHQMMKAQGFDVNRPVSLRPEAHGGPMVSDGNHRLSVAFDLHPDSPIPVRHVTEDAHIQEINRVQRAISSFGRVCRSNRVQ